MQKSKGSKIVGKSLSGSPRSRYRRWKFPKELKGFRNVDDSLHGSWRFQKWGGKSTRKSNKRSWNYNRDFTWKSKVPGVGTRVYAGVKRFQNYKQESMHTFRTFKFHLHFQDLWFLQGLSPPFSRPSILTMWLFWFWINLLGKWFWKVSKLVYHVIYTFGTLDFCSHSWDLQLLCGLPTPQPRLLTPIPTTRTLDSHVDFHLHFWDPSTHVQTFAFSFKTFNSHSAQ